MVSKVKDRRLLVCDCENSMALDGDALKRCIGGEGELPVYSNLCRTQLENYADALKSGDPLMVACTQEAPLFRELADENGGADIVFANIRERAGWSDAKNAALPKIAALLAEAAHESKSTGTTPIVSEGVCLVYGAGQPAMDVAEQLAGRLNVSLMLTDADDIVPPSTVNVPIYKGRITAAQGTLGSFEITVDDYAPVSPSSKDKLNFLMERNGASSQCDLIFDMSGGTPLFAAAARRDGYFCVDPDYPAGVANAMFEISDLVGEFEKPLYVAYDADICAHSRSGKIGCSNCLDNCPMSAISPDGDGVHIDPLICGGCGNCSATCPTGAVSYAFPQRADVIARMQILADTFLEAGGREPVLLIHDEKHGAGLISAMARFGKGLPANMLPLSLYTVTQLGHDAMLAAIVSGFSQILVLGPPDRQDDLPALKDQIALAQTFLEGLGFGEENRIALLVEQDPNVVEAYLHDLPKLKSAKRSAFTAVGGKREIARTVLDKLNEIAPEPAEILPLPSQAPYGRLQINVAGCTLCLACVSACPADALADSPDHPQLRFTEAACVQCGLCVGTCPESVITLQPQYNFTSAALSAEVLNEDEPFECISCGKPFGTKAAIERVTASLEGKHWMFQDSDQTMLIKMCDDCRVIALSEKGDDPFAEGTRPKVRTTEDYLAAEEKARETGKSPEDFLD
ncbi:MAG: 4Fe-4S dicluster domain-containing protein [Hyphomicrobiaceae bacterium]|nr:4Fe-4S dicluster domain-containing protein [Hyphomicrobiaceae bacterium]